MKKKMKRLRSLILTLVIVENIYSRQLHKMFTVKIIENDTEYTFQVSALSYANRMLSNASMPQTLKNVCKALYLYNKYAIQAFGTGN